MEERKTPKNIELRSEKVRSIVGQVPPALVRYGSLLVLLVLLILLGIAHMLPYRQIVEGEAIVRTMPQPSSHPDTLLLHVDLRWSQSVADISPVGCALSFDGPEVSVQGRVVAYAPLRSPEGTHAAQIALPAAAAQSIAPSTLDCRLILGDGSLLQHFVGR